MEGAYNRVLTARQTVPHETYVYFMDLLANTVRDEIAGWSEKAYDCLSVNAAKQMLLFSSDKELLDYVNEVFDYGSVQLKTYLPNGDIDLTVLKVPNHQQQPLMFFTFYRGKIRMKMLSTKLRILSLLMRRFSIIDL